jgi:hypothetical protein
LPLKHEIAGKSAAVDAVNVHQSQLLLLGSHSDICSVKKNARPDGRASCETEGQAIPGMRLVQDRTGGITLQLRYQF